MRAHPSRSRAKRIAAAAAGLPCLRAALLAGAGLALAMLAPDPAHAVDGTWTGPGSEWTTGTNWSSTPTVPDGTASFTGNAPTSVSISANASINTIQLDAGAYTFTNAAVFNITGTGIVINGGSATIINNLLLQFLDGSTAGSATITNDSLAVLQFFNTSTAGSATITNNGLFQFFATSTAGNATIANNSGLSFFATSTAGSATITNNVGGIVQFSNASTAGGATILNNGGAVQFFDTSTAGNATITNNATLEFFHTSTAGSATITNNVGGIVQFNATSTAGSATITNNDVINFNNTSTAGSAVITNNGTGNLFFNTSSTAGSATITNNFIVTFNNTSTAGSATITNNVVLQFLDTSTAGSATISNNGGLSFVDTSTAGSATITNNDTLTFSNTSTAGSATITTNAGATTRFLIGSTGGDARFITNLGGIFDMSGLTAAGMTAGSIEGAGSTILGAKALTVGSNNLSTDVSGIISGLGGSLTKVGTGTLILSGTNTYTGATTVNAGVLQVDGSIASSVLTTVNAGGTLGGAGTIGSTTINGGGSFAPGTPGVPGTAMTVSGSLAFQSGALYVVQLNPASSTIANVTGSATLTGGSVQAIFSPGAYTTRNYTILHSGTLGGTTFSGVSGSPPNFTSSLSYTATDVILNLTATLGTGTGLNQNQQNVATAINNFFNNGGALPPNFLTIFGLTGGNLANALTLLSGEAATGAQQGAFQLMTQFLGLMLDPFVDGRSGVGGAGGGAIGFAPERPEMPDDIALAYAKVMKAPVYKAAPSFEQRWSIWGGAYGGYNKTNGDPVVVGSHDLTARTGGFAAGMDYRVAPGTVLGFALAGGGTNWSLANGLGSGKSDAFQAGVYGSTRSGPLYVAAAFAYSWYDVSTDRFAFAGNHLAAEFNAQSFGGRIETGYRIGSPTVHSSGGAIIPYAAVQAQSFRTPSYAETDLNNGGFGLAYAARTGTATRSELGARFDHAVVLDRNAVLALRGRLAWAHDWVSDPALTAGFQTLPGASFIVNGATPAKDLALVSAGTELRLANGVTLAVKFDGELADGSSTYAGTGTVRVNW